MTALVDAAPVFALEIRAAGSDSPRRARRWLAWVLEVAGVPQATVDTAVLAASELVTNSALHAGGRVLVSAQLLDRAVLLIVHDDGRTAWPTTPTPDLDEHGRGLVIVRALASHFEVTTDADGTTVAALIAP